MVVAAAAEIPNWLCNGASAKASITVEQFGLVTRQPPFANPRRARCTSSRERWVWLTSGTSNGTSSSIRQAEELLITG
jgi:hypothetical protein